MKHARPDYDVIQDNSSGQELAQLVLDHMTTPQGSPACLSVDPLLAARARLLAKRILDHPVAIPADQFSESLVIDSPGELSIPEDEPVFLIRGQDIVAGAAVRAWADLAEKSGASPTIVEMARDHAVKMTSWQTKKVADLPKLASSDNFAVVEWSKCRGHESPWYEGTVIPTGQYRLKEWGQSTRLQHLVTDTAGRRKHWVTVPVAPATARDDV